jgi:hypothetical protein
MQQSERGGDMKIKGIFSIVVAVLLSIIVTGCAGIDKQAFNKAANQELKTIGLLEPAASGEYVVQNLGHPGMGFGLIGGLIAVADMQSKTNRFTELMKERNLNVSDEFQSKLTAELQNRGYAVKVIKPERSKPALLENYDALEKDVDAYLDLGVNAGYMCASATADYVPTVRSIVRLVKKGSNEILYQDIIAYGYEFRAAQAVSIPADQQYFFKDFDVLTSDPDLAMEGLKRGIPLVTSRIAQDLAK